MEHLLSEETLITRLPEKPKQEINQTCVLKLKSILLYWILRMYEEGCKETDRLFVDCNVLNLSTSANSAEA